MASPVSFTPVDLVPEAEITFDVSPSGAWMSVSVEIRPPAADPRPLIGPFHSGTWTYILGHPWTVSTAIWHRFGQTVEEGLARGLLP